MQVKRRHIGIEAIQFTKEMVLEEEPLPKGILFYSKQWNPKERTISSYKFLLKTSIGETSIRIGDWKIIENGTIFLCEEKDFNLLFEEL